MEKHIKVLGTFHLIFGLMGLLALMIVFLVFVGGFAFIGMHSGDHVPFWLAGAFGSLLLIITLVSAVPGILCGYGLLRKRPWARILGIILSFIYLLEFPLGTALGIYSLWVLFHGETLLIFEGRGPYAAQHQPKTT